MEDLQGPYSRWSGFYSKALHDLWTAVVPTCVRDQVLKIGATWCEKCGF